MRHSTCPSLEARRETHLLKVEQGPPAARARYVLRFRIAHPASLHGTAKGYREGPAAIRQGRNF